MSQTDVFIIPSTGTAIIFDIVESETHVHKSTATEHPVETGSNISDHIRNDPIRVTIKGVVSNFPITLGDNGSTLQGLSIATPKPLTKQLTNVTVTVPKPPTPISLTGAISLLSDLIFGTPPIVAQVEVYKSQSGNNNATAQLQGFPSADFDNVTTVHNNLTAIRDAGLLCEVFTSTKAYDSMVIESIELVKEDKGAGSFTVELKRIIQVTSAVVAAPVPLIKAGSPPAPKGSQVPQEMSSAERASLLKKAKGAVWDLAGKALGG